MKVLSPRINVVDYLAAHFNLPGKKILDIGTYNGRNAKQLAEKGAIVTAIDVESLQVFGGANFTFIQSSFEEFESNEVFDIAIAYNVFQYFAQKKIVVEKLLNSADVVFFNVWGKKHQWYTEGSGYTPHQIGALKRRIKKSHEIILFQEAQYQARAQDSSIVNAHCYFFCIKKPPL